MGVSKKIINVYFRISLINKNGLGHLIRCLRFCQTLPQKYKKIFLVDCLNKQIPLNINLKNYEIINLYEKRNKFINNLYDAKKILKIIKYKKNNYFFVDDYRINYTWHKKIYKYCKKLIVIDDLLDRKFFCDFYINFKKDLDGNLHKLAKKKNIKKNKILINPKYCILDRNLENKSNNKIKNKKTILISFGNSFDFKKYEAFFKNIQKINCKILICVGIFSKNYEYLFKLSKKNKNFKIIFKKMFIEKYFNNINLFIGSAGNSIYEMSYLNVPSIFTQLSKNQKNDIKFLENLGHFFFLNKKEFFTNNCINLISKIISKYEKVKLLNKFKKIYLDKNGATRIKKAIF